MGPPGGQVEILDWMNHFTDDLQVQDESNSSSSSSSHDIIVDIQNLQKDEDNVDMDI